MEEKNFCYEYPRPAVSTDCVIFGTNDIEISVLLIERGGDPFRGYWALPGGFVQMDENTWESARRELLEETGINDIEIEQLHTFTDVNRHPKERVISVAYFGLVRTEGLKIKAGDDAANIKWQNINNIPNLAFDHNKIIAMASIRLAEKIKLLTKGEKLFNQNYTEDELKKLYSSITA